MTNWFKRFFNTDPPPENTGAILPTPEQVAAMPHFSEIVATAAPVSYRPFDMAKLPDWPDYDQFSTYECVPTTDSLIDTILFWLRRGYSMRFSPSWKYLQRINKPEGGMIGTDIVRIDRQIGAIPYDLMPTPTTEAKVADLVAEPWMLDIAKVFQNDDDCILVPIKDFDTLVSIQQVTGKPIMVWFEFSMAEWTSQPFISTQPLAIRHSVTFVPPRQPGDMSVGLLPSGEPAIVIQDSAFKSSGINGKLRIISKSYFNKRNIFAMYKMRFKFDVNPNKPHWDGTIKSLQACLRSAGFFPTNVDFVESMGPVTKASIGRYQTARALPLTSTLDEVTKAAIAKEF